jgi:hypothetical protein
VYSSFCKKYQGRLIELARGARDDELRDHLRCCAECERAFEAQLRLSDAAAMLAMSAQIEASVLAEFDRAHAPSYRRQYLGAAAIAAALLLTWAFWRPAPAPQPKPEPVQTANILVPPLSVPVVSPRPVTPVTKAPRRKPPKARTPEPEQPFIAIPYTAPLGPDERADIVRMDLPVSALIAAGFPLGVADPGASARADLVVSQDGRARAVRLISISNSTNRSF